MKQFCRVKIAVEVMRHFLSCASQKKTLLSNRIISTHGPRVKRFSGMTIADLRQEYTRAGLRRADLSPHPFQQFSKFFDEAVSAGVTEPNAMTLSTVDASGQPSGRTVLLKVHDARGFGFFSNYESRKGHDLAANPKACLTFLWQQLERQVIIRGEVSRLGREESTQYFLSRPLGSQLGAWVSEQSSVVPGRDFLEEKLKEVVATGMTSYELSQTVRAYSVSSSSS